jgi:hypothetical protein
VGASGCLRSPRLHLGAERHTQGVADTDSTLLRAAEAWVGSNTAALDRRGVSVHVSGPHDPCGMDPVYVVGLDSARAEVEARLFRGGTVLLAGYAKSEAAELEQWHAQVETAQGVLDVLDELAGRV